MAKLKQVRGRILFMAYTRGPHHKTVYTRTLNLLPLTQTISLSVAVYGCETVSQTLRARQTQTESA
jgi:hypothetical protein